MTPGRWLAALASSLMLAGAAAAHEIFDAAAAEDFLEQVATHQSALAAGDAEAAFALGEVLADSTALLNNDIAAHGGTPGIAPSIYLSELARFGIDLVFMSEAGRFKIPVEPYVRYLALRPHGPNAAAAGFRRITAAFYDSFISDPFAPVALDWSDLLHEIAAAEALIAHHPDHPDMAEAAFILAVNYARAAAMAPEPATAAEYRERALVALKEYQAGWPDTLRGATAAFLLGRLQDE